jgi:hypothetical protein
MIVVLANNWDYWDSRYTVSIITQIIEMDKHIHWTAR